MKDRREFMQGAAIAAAGASLLSGSGIAMAADKPQATTGATEQPPLWPNGERLVISISLQFEAGAQPADAESPFPALDKRYIDTIAPTWYQYGMIEGVPRLLDLFDKHDIKVTSHMVGKAVEARPDLAAEVVRRGHEASGHGMFWAPQYSLTPDQERANYQASADLIEKVTGQRPVGFNAFWMRHTRETLNILQDLGFIYHIDDLSRDEPSVTPVQGKPFAVVPYTLRNNDIGRFASSSAMTGAAFLQELKDEFDVLYEEGASRRRMMSISAHDRIAGAPTVVRALDHFIAYAKSKSGVAFMRKDDIAKWALSRSDTPVNPPRTF